MLDSGATRTICNDSRMLVKDSLRDLERPLTCKIADGTKLQLTKGGAVQFQPSFDQATGASVIRTVTLSDAVYDTRINTNLLSIHSLTSAGLEANRRDKHAFIRDKTTRQLVMTIPKIGKLYVFRLKMASTTHDAAYMAQTRAAPKPIPLRSAAAAVALRSALPHWWSGNARGRAQSLDNGDRLHLSMGRPQFSRRQSHVT